MLIFIGCVFGVLLVVGLPIAFVMGLTTVFTFIYIGNPTLYNLVPQRMFAGMGNFLFVAIPFFVMAGEIMTVGGITRDLINFCNLFVGRLRGGLAHIVITSSIFLSGISGSAASDAASIGSIMIPAMTEEGYDLDFSAAVTSAASVLGPIIPPSIIMIIYASLMDVSVAALFIAGYLPGIIIGIFLMIMAYIISRRRKYPIHKERVTFNKALRVTIAALPALMLPFIIIVGIVSGAFTPTEASVVAAAYALVLSLLKKNLSVRDITRIVSKSMKISSLILFLIGTGIALGWILTFEQIPQKIATLLLSVVGGNPIAVLFMIFIILTLAGMFLDTAVSIIVLGPLLLNTAVAVGLHPLHFALIMVMTLCVGLITPPLGLSLFVVCGITNLKLEVLTKATIPFIIVESIAILIVIYFPSLTMFVPKMFGYYP